MPEDAKSCAKCGASLAQGAVFCSSCGSPVSGVAASVSAQAPPPFTHRGEKQEKSEKGEKQEKHGKAEKGEDRGGAVVGGLILVWLGISFYLQQISAIPRVEWWAYFLSGLGVILILQGVVRRTRTGRPLTGSVVGGAVLLVIGMTGILGIGSFWPWVLVLLGIIVILSGMTARRRSPKP